METNLQTPELFSLANESEARLPTAAGSPPPVLDACCGSKMFWFDDNDPRALFMDRRTEAHTLNDKSSKGGKRELVIKPDVEADFTAMPFEDESFNLVVFDPPHLLRAGPQSWMAKKYGKLEGNWQEMLRAGFRECFRVLRPGATLIFKWNETQIPVREILTLTPARPLLGQRCGKTARTHWIIFMKEGNVELRRANPDPPADNSNQDPNHEK